jgi:hypothetical protein
VGLAPLARSNDTAIAIAYRRRQDARPKKDDKPTDPISSRYGFIALLEGLRNVSPRDRSARELGTAINVA